MPTEFGIKKLAVMTVICHCPCSGHEAKRHCLFPNYTKTIFISFPGMFQDLHGPDVLLSAPLFLRADPSYLSPSLNDTLRVSSFSLYCSKDFNFHFVYQVVILSTKHKIHKQKLHVLFTLLPIYSITLEICSVIFISLNKFMNHLRFIKV